MSSEISMYNDYIKHIFIENNFIFNKIYKAVIEKNNEKIDEEYKKYNENNDKINSAIHTILNLVNRHFLQA